MKKIIFSLFDDENIADKLANQLKIEKGFLELRNFPDKETYLRVKSNVQNKSIILLCFLDNPNHKLLPLYFLARTLKELGANKITLIIPYMPYMRQDARFNTGEAITSGLFAQLIASFCDSIVTIDPHLHRIKTISDIYPVPIVILHSTAIIADWIVNNIKLPLIIGPDEESSQWSSEVAKLANAPCVIARKKRLGDKNVIINLPKMDEKFLTPIIVDDIISSGTTMRVLINNLIEKGFKNPVCIGIHTLLNKKNYNALINSGAKKVISCNTILHFSNQINIFNLLIEGIKQS